MAVGIADALQLGLRHAAFVALPPDLAVPADGDLQPFRQGIDAGNAHAVQPA